MRENVRKERGNIIRDFDGQTNCTSFPQISWNSENYRADRFNFSLNSTTVSWTSRRNLINGNYVRPLTTLSRLECHRTNLGPFSSVSRVCYSRHVNRLDQQLSFSWFPVIFRQSRFHNFPATGWNKRDASKSYFTLEQHFESRLLLPFIFYFFPSLLSFFWC